jgi:UDP-glucuronate decarboxylase
MFSAIFGRRIQLPGRYGNNMELNYTDTRVVDAERIVREDLGYIIDNAASELAALSGKNVLITGGAGFLGYYLVQSLLFWNTRYPDKKPIGITLLDNFIRGLPDWIELYSKDPNLELVRHDVTHPLPQDLKHHEYIIHAASIASPTFYRRYPIETMDANVNGLRYLLESWKKQKENGKQVDGFLFYSTSEIYGDPTPENIPTPETYRGNVSCTGPRACYDESKRYGETLCVNFARIHELPIKIARPFNNYGPGLKITDKRVLPDIAKSIVANLDIVLHSDGSPTRTFCYIADAIVGYIKILVKGRPGEAYNIGIDKPEISMLQLAEIVAGIARAEFGYTGKIVHESSKEKEYLTDNPYRRCPIIDKARNELGYNPGISLEEGLFRSLTWYFGNSTAEDA